MSAELTPSSLPEIGRENSPDLPVATIDSGSDSSTEISVDYIDEVPPPEEEVLPQLEEEEYEDDPAPVPEDSITESQEESAPEIPVQENLETLLALWPKLVEEFGNIHPLWGAHFQNCTATQIDENSVKVLFSDSASFELVTSNRELQNKLKAFLQQKVTQQNSFKVEWELDATTKPENPELPPVVDQRLLGEDELLENVPILKKIQEMFGGRIIN